MVAVTFDITPREARDIEAIACGGGRVLGTIQSASLDAMARALLLGHVTLVKDCGGILPDSRVKIKHGAATPRTVQFKSNRGVSLSGGVK